MAAAARRDRHSLYSSIISSTENVAALVWRKVMYSIHTSMFAGCIFKRLCHLVMVCASSHISLADLSSARCSFGDSAFAGTARAFSSIETLVSQSAFSVLDLVDASVRKELPDTARVTWSWNSASFSQVSTSCGYCCNRDENC